MLSFDIGGMISTGLESFFSDDDEITKGVPLKNGSSSLGRFSGMLLFKLKSQLKKNFNSSPKSILFYKFTGSWVNIYLNLNKWSISSWILKWSRYSSQFSWVKFSWPNKWRLLINLLMFLILNWSYLWATIVLMSWLWS